MQTDVQDVARARTGAAGSPPGATPPLPLLAERGGVPDCERSTDGAHVLDDMVHLVRCLIELDETDARDRWTREAVSYEALAKARRSLHRCARNRGMA